jgi:hypothetical protein
MPKITDSNVLKILLNPYFDQHTAMHLARERVTLPNGKTLPLILPPCLCDNCRDDGKPAGKAGAAKAGAPKAAAGKAAAMPGMGNSGMMGGAGGPMGMIEVGQPGSGRQLLEMHHEMLRVFRFLLEHHNPPMRFLAEWRNGDWNRPAGNGAGYAPQLWGLDHPDGLPHEIIGMLAVTDPNYLGLVFNGVHRLIQAANNKLDDAVDNLGRYIEQGVKTGEPDGSGFHDTMHEFLAAREGRAAQGAEMNKLANSRFNEYFWGLHLWIDGQYGRLLEKHGHKFVTTPLDPKTLNMCTSTDARGKMTMAMGKATP